MNNHDNGFCLGYFTKQAGPSDAGVEAIGGIASTGKDIAMSILPYLIVAPAVFGVAAGAIHSKVTSPSKIDKDLVQKAVLSQNLDQQIAELRRRRLQRQDRMEQASDRPAERSLHIG